MGTDMKDMIRHHVTINGIEVDAEYSPQTVQEIFLPLLQKLTAMQKAAGRRILVMLVAPPGAGKTTLLSFLYRLSREQSGITPIQVIGMDGFHRRQEYLESHHVLRDGESVPMVKIKGAPVTFDLDKLKSSIQIVSEGKPCGWPRYERLLHNTVENAIFVDSDIVILEGNYLLLDMDGWRELSGYADYTVSVTADEDFLRARLIDRRVKTGPDEAESTRFVDYSDMPNVRLCLEKTKPTDLQLRLDETGDYHVIRGVI